MGQAVAKTDLPVTEAEWRNMLRRSSVHLVTPSLRWAFHEQDHVSAAPPHVVEFIDAVYTLNLDGNRDYEDQLADLIVSMNEIGVRPLLLKGAAALVGELYPTSGERMIGDIDVLVPASRVAEVRDRLITAGYREWSMDLHLLDPNGHHYRPLDSPNWPVRVELHIHPVFRIFTELLGSDEMFREASRLSWRGGECRLPSPTHFILHNVIHAFLMHFVVKGEPLSQRQLFEFALAARTHSRQIDWRFIVDRFGRLGYASALRHYALLSTAYFGFKIPVEIEIDVWSRLRATIHLIRLDLSAPAIEGPLALWRELWARALRVRKNPANVKKLFAGGFYSRLWSAVIEKTRARL